MADEGSGPRAAPRAKSPTPGAPAAEGAPADALPAFAAAWAEQAGRMRLGQADPCVSVAFTLGWQMAELYRPDRRRGRAPVDADDLPGISSLTLDELEAMGLDQIRAGINKLREPILRAGLELPDVDRFDVRLSGLADPAARKLGVREFHVGLLSTLAAADFRLSKAYGLGRALADTTRHPPDYRKELSVYRVAILTGWVRELATALPPHAARPVAASLEAWTRSVNGAGSDNDDAPRQLSAQGRLWRSLLSGEKQATDVLETSDYLRAAERTLQRSAALVRHFLRHYLWLVALVVTLFAAGIIVVATASGTAGIVAGIGPILASFGLTWKGIGASTGTVTSRLEAPVWQAELDTVIYERITPKKIVESQGTITPAEDEPSLIAGATEAPTVPLSPGQPPVIGHNPPPGSS